MILDERLRWMGFWMLDKMKGGKIREYYDQIRYAWKEGSSFCGLSRCAGNSVSGRIRRCLCSI